MVPVSYGRLLLRKRNEVVAENKEIHKFAVTYLRLFSEMDPPENMLTKLFGDNCRALGFQSDLGESFMRMYPGDAFYDAPEFAKIADQITDPYLLGTAIYSRWRLITQWEAETLFAEDRREWFRSALGRLAEMTASAQDEETRLSGHIQSIQIVSNNMQGVPGSAMASGMEQRVLITSEGEVTSAATKYNASPGGHNLITQYPAIRIDRDGARKIMEGIGTAFPYLPSEGPATGSGLTAAPGTWTLTVTNQWGRPYRTSGEIGARIIVDGTDLSDLIRDTTGNDTLLVFDGNPDLVMRLEVKYRRGIPVYPEQNAEEDAETGVQWVYFEQLIFDRRTDSMEHFLDAGPAHRTRTSSHISGAVSDFLDMLDPEGGFSDPAGNPPEAVKPATEVAAYQITIVTKYGNTRTIHGTYDARSLPAEWGVFIDRALTFMSFFGFGELFDEGRYGRALRLTTDYVYVLVASGEDEEPRWYLSDEPDIEDNEIVLLPNGTRAGQVLQVVYGPRADAPEPFAELAHVVPEKKREPGAQTASNR